MATRINLFLSTAPAQGAPLSVIGKPYQALLTALGADAALERYHLARAAEIAPTLAGGLNIEGLTARNDGGVIIGFRSPVPDGRALLVGLKNPVEVARTEAMPIFDAVHQLDLGEGRGVRGLSAWHGRYLVIGGSPTHTTVSQLYTWDGVSPTARPIAVDLGAYNPEAFFTPEARDAFMLLSDDGHVERAGTLCKLLPNPASKSFRGLWLSLPDGHGPR